MIKFDRYPHVKDIIEYYALRFDDKNVTNILKNGVLSKNDASSFSKFIWKVVDQMALDSEQGVTVLGRVDNSDTLPDIHYEVTLYMESTGYDAVWDEISDKA